MIAPSQFYVARDAQGNHVVWERVSPVNDNSVPHEKMCTCSDGYVGEAKAYTIAAALNQAKAEEKLC